MQFKSRSVRTAILLALAIMPMAVGCSSRRSAEGGLTTMRPIAVDPVIAKIRDEGLNRSQVIETLDYLCNVIGPRLTSSPNLARANLWTRDRLAGWGLSNARVEPWGEFGRGWSLERFSMQTTEPTVTILNAYPKAWSPGFDEPLDAAVIHLNAKDEAGLEAYRGKLRGQIVLVGAPRGVDARFEPLGTRITEERLALLEKAPSGVAASSIQVQPQTETAAERRARFRETSRAGEALMNNRRRGAATRPATRPSTPSAETFQSRLFAFAAEEGAALVVTPTSKGDGGTIFVAGAAIPNDPPRVPGEPPEARKRVWSVDAPAIPAQVMMGVEDYNRLCRLAERGLPVRANVDLAVKFHDEHVTQSNTVAEIPGTDLKDEIVMIGGHLDSWHSASGATDNAVGASAAMEAVRIIKALGLKPRRTIRVALWTGEEQGLHGSSNYVKQHFAYTPDAPATQPTTREGDQSTTRRAGLVKLPEYEKLSVYFNLDNGTGRIRGIYTQGNEAAVPIFRKWLEPFHDLDAKTVTLANTASTDHIPFDRVGLPGFQFIQDPIEYGSRTHHSNMDNFDRIQQQDMKQNATIMAAFIWNAANMDERFPRKPVSEERER